MHYNLPMFAQLSSSLYADMQQRFAELLTATRRFPILGSCPVTIAGRYVGWLHPRAQEVLADWPKVRRSSVGFHIAEDLPPSAELNHYLAELAQTLNDGGCVKAWRDELLDVHAEGQIIGVIERGASRALGLLTQAVHLHAWAPDGKLWVQQRAPHKATDPNMWDTLVGGLASAQECLTVSLLRECQEEAGLCATELCDLSSMHCITRMHRPLQEGFQAENVWVNDCILPSTCTPSNQDGEVSDIACISVEQYWEMAQAKQFTLEAEIVILYCILQRCAPHAVR